MASGVMLLLEKRPQIVLADRHPLDRGPSGVERREPPGGLNTERIDQHVLEDELHVADTKQRRARTLELAHTRRRGADLDAAGVPRSSVSPWLSSISRPCTSVATSARARRAVA